ncbi:hypothetical protein B9Z55_017953 [Caenorhabditis nigoni]|uniref:Uncharacterized protein n=1 Tax=Caenorhabditis nigoni TaxID=1611254 RepID=A0A2G5TBX8_9PELO|nr:hypothetical protein B9Z55_017953 [Caenorhabditis nigoni]
MMTTPNQFIVANMKFSRFVLGSSKVFTPSESKIDCLPEVFKACEWIYWNHEKIFNPENFEEVTLPPDTNDIKYFFDCTDKNIYMSGFVNHENLHKSPVKIICFVNNNVKVGFRKKYF